MQCHSLKVLACGPADGAAGCSGRAAAAATAGHNETEPGQDQYDQEKGFQSFFQPTNFLMWWGAGFCFWG